MLKPEENKRDWFLFYMPPAGMAGKHPERDAEAGGSLRRGSVLVLLLGLVLLAALAGAYFGG